METDFQTQLNAFYQRQKIHPLDFDCRNKIFCRQYSTGDMTEAKMSMVGSQYGRKYPRITIISLDPPNDDKGTFKLPDCRTTAYVSKYHEEENYRINRPNVHWAMSQIIVKDILVMFGYTSQADSSVVYESYSGREIENVSAFFAHINVAKCSMNNEGKGQADWQVHQKCGNAYLHQELKVLLPEIIVSQGKDANGIIGKLFGFAGIEDRLPASKLVQIRDKQVLWMPMDHPARHTGEIRQRWSFYVEAISNWKSVNYDSKSEKLEGRKTILDLKQQFSSTKTPPLGFTPEIRENENMPTDYGLYKCDECGKMVMGFEKQDHEQEKHGGKSVEWKKVR